MAQTVQIYCDNTKHPRRRVKIVRFAHDALTNDWRWEGFTDDAIVFLDGPRALSGPAEYAQVMQERMRTLATDPSAEGPRIRYELACPLCQLRLRLTMENLHPILDEVAAAGVSDIQLKALISILS